jgi:hypothetical protein
VDADALLSVAQRVDGGARISAVSKAPTGTLIKIVPSSTCGTAVGLTTLAAIKVAFPFATVSAVEHAATGNTELQILVHAGTEEYRFACTDARNIPFMRALRVLYRGVGLLAVCSYGCLLYTAAFISPLDAR